MQQSQVSAFGKYGEQSWNLNRSFNMSTSSSRRHISIEICKFVISPPQIDRNSIFVPCPKDPRVDNNLAEYDCRLILRTVNTRLETILTSQSLAFQTDRVLIPGGSRKRSNTSDNNSMLGYTICRRGKTPRPAAPIAQCGLSRIITLASHLARYIPIPRYERLNHVYANWPKLLTLRVQLMYANNNTVSQFGRCRGFKLSRS